MRVHTLASPHTAGDIRLMAEDGPYGVPVEWKQLRELKAGDGVVLTSVDEVVFVGDVTSLDPAGADDRAYLLLR
jgi:hypothetical protein